MKKFEKLACKLTAVLLIVFEILLVGPNFHNASFRASIFVEVWNFLVFAVTDLLKFDK